MHTDKGLSGELSVTTLLHCIRGIRVILDSDLAKLYHVPTKRLNEQYRRNRGRFPGDFAFELTKEDWEALRPQIATLKAGRGEHRKYLPVAFTEHGAPQAANILNSPRANAMRIYVIRALVRMREEQAADTTILRRSAEGFRAPLERRRDKKGMENIC